MFFTRLAYVVAVIALLLGVYNLGLVAAIEFEIITPREEAIRRFIGSSIGRGIDRGVYALLAGIAFGALAEIGTALRKRSIAPKQFLGMSGVKSGDKSDSI